VVASPYRRAADLPLVIPVFPVDGALLLPHGQLPLRVFEPRYLNMIDDAMGAERMIGMIQTKAGGDRERPSLASVGCLGRITSFAETSDDQYLITLTGVCRFAAGEEQPARAPYRQVRANYLPYELDLRPPADDEGFDRVRLLRVLKAFLERRSLGVDWDTAKNAPTEALINSLSMALPFEASEKQALLEAATIADRREALITLLEIDTAGRSGEDEPPPLQ
jgi:Lon protease-like protein